MCLEDHNVETVPAGHQISSSVDFIGCDIDVIGHKLLVVA